MDIKTVSFGEVLLDIIGGEEYIDVAPFNESGSLSNIMGAFVASQNGAVPEYSDEIRRIFQFIQ